MHPQAEPSLVERYLKRRALRRKMLIVFCVLVAGSIVLGNLWHAYQGGDDWARFDRRQFFVRSVIAGDEIIIESADGQVRAIVRLLGIDAPDLTPADSSPAVHASHWSAESLEALTQLAQGRRVLLSLPGLAPRAGDGVLQAYVYLDADAASVSANERLIAAGHAYADQRITHPFQKQFDQAESEARRKKIGLWSAITDNRQPAWRQQWLRQFRTDALTP